MGKLLMNYMTAYPYRFHFTLRDRRECFETIASIIRLVYRKKEIGRENLEEDAYQTDDFFLKKALFLFIDKLPVETVIEILETYIVFGEYQGKELLEKVIIINGLTSLFNDENPGVIEERLKSYIGEQCMADYETFRKGNPAYKEQERKKQKVEAVSEFVPRQKIVAEPLSSNKVLTQGEIDKLLERLLG